MQRILQDRHEAQEREIWAAQKAQADRCRAERDEAIKTRNAKTHAAAVKARTNRQEKAARTAREKVSRQKAARDAQGRIDDEKLQKLEPRRQQLEREIFETERVTRRLQAELKILESLDYQGMAEERQTDYALTQETFSTFGNLDEENANAKHERLKERLRRLASRRIKEEEVSRTESKRRHFNDMLFSVKTEIIHLKKQRKRRIENVQLQSNLEEDVAMLAESAKTRAEKEGATLSKVAKAWAQQQKEHVEAREIRLEAGRNAKAAKEQAAEAQRQRAENVARRAAQKAALQEQEQRKRDSERNLERDPWGRMKYAREQNAVAEQQKREVREAQAPYEALQAYQTHQACQFTEGKPEKCKIKVHEAQKAVAEQRKRKFEDPYLAKAQRAEEEQDIWRNMERGLNGEQDEWRKREAEKAAKEAIEGDAESARRPGQWNPINQLYDRRATPTPNISPLRPECRGSHLPDIAYGIGSCTNCRKEEFLWNGELFQM